VHKVLIRLQQECGLIQKELGRLSDTRWFCRCQYVLVIKERFDVIADVLNEVQHLGDAEIYVQAKGLVHHIQSCQFIAIILFMYITCSSCTL